MAEGVEDVVVVEDVVCCDEVAQSFCVRHDEGMDAGCNFIRGLGRLMGLLQEVDCDWE